MRYASHYFELNTVPSTINVTFEPYNSGTSFQVNAISFSSSTPSVYTITSDTETSLDFGSEQDKVIISVVVDGNTPGAQNNYELTISPSDLDIVQNSAKTPTEFTISHIYPNPFNPITNISYTLPENTRIKIEVFDISGKRVQTLINEFQTLGNHSINWNALSQSTGIYFLQLQAGKYVETKKVTYIK